MNNYGIAIYGIVWCEKVKLMYVKLIFYMGEMLCSLFNNFIHLFTCTRNGSCRRAEALIGTCPGETGRYKYEPCAPLFLNTTTIIRRGLNDSYHDLYVERYDFSEFDTRATGFGIQTMNIRFLSLFSVYPYQIKGINNVRGLSLFSK